MHKKTSTPVVISLEERNKIIKMVHDGSSNSSESSALSNHRGRDATLGILRKRFYWPNMTVDAKNYIKKCDICQKVNPSSLKFNPELKPIHVPKKVNLSLCVIYLIPIKIKNFTTNIFHFLFCFNF